MLRPIEDGQIYFSMKAHIEIDVLAFKMPRYSCFSSGRWMHLQCGEGEYTESKKETTGVRMRLKTSDLPTPHFLPLPTKQIRKKAFDASQPDMYSTRNCVNV